MPATRAGRAACVGLAALAGPRPALPQSGRAGGEVRQGVHGEAGRDPHLRGGRHRRLAGAAQQAGPASLLPG